MWGSEWKPLPWPPQVRLRQPSRSASACSCLRTPAPGWELPGWQGVVREQQCSPNLGSTCLPRPCLLVPFSKFLPVGHPSFLRQDCAWPGLTAQAQPPFCFLTRGPLGPQHRVGAPGERPRGRKLCCPVGGHGPPSRILAQSSTAGFRFHLNLWFSWPHRHLQFKACSQWDGGQHPKVSLEPPSYPEEGTAAT